MPWVKTDENMPIHPKLFRAGFAAYGWWHAAISYCNRFLTDGYIPETDVLLVYPGSNPEAVKDVVAILVREGLLEHVREGFKIHDYLDYQPSKKDVLKTRRMRAASGRKGGEKTREIWRANSPITSQGTLLGSRPGPARPVPTEESKSKAIRGGSPGAAPSPPPPVAAADQQFLEACPAPYGKAWGDADWWVSLRDGYPKIDVLREASRYLSHELAKPEHQRQRALKQGLRAWVATADRWRQRDADRKAVRP